jgi:hypothetical protein
MFPTSITIGLHNREVPRNRNAPCDYLYRTQWKKGNYTSDFPDIGGASNSTSCEITKASKWHRLGDTLAMDWLHAAWKKNYSHTERRYSVGVSRKLMSVVGHFINPALLPSCRQSLRWS